MNLSPGAGARPLYARIPRGEILPDTMGMVFLEVVKALSEIHHCRIGKVALEILDIRILNERAGMGIQAQSLIPTSRNF